MRVTFAYDKKAGKPHYQVRHRNIREHEFTEVFCGSMVVIGQQGRVLKAVGRTFQGRFLTVVFLRVREDHYHVITAWPSTRKQILSWHRELK
jgi:uncharacterized DUF497 family protein